MQPAVDLAIAQVNSDPLLLPNHSLSIAWADTECSAHVSGVALAELIQNNPDAVGILGAGCSSACKPAAYISESFKLPQVSFACTSPEYSSTATYPYFMRTSVTDSQFKYPWAALCAENSWTKVITIAGDSACM